ncbi:MAG: 3'-5' exonuclease [bacterium]|nr:3'-5' exonuclease [bacterium]
MGNIKMPEQVIVVDLEATCWLTRPYSTNRDIIEVGACILDTRSGEISRKASILVRPTHSRIGLYCRFVTGMTPEKVKNGVEFRQACGWLRAVYGAMTPWAAWGSWDHAQMVAQCTREQVSYPFSPEHIDIKLLVAERLGWKQPKSLPYVLAALGMKFQGEKHRAMDDAINEAHVLYKVLQQ